jgi:large subunit ribosomal protein L13
VDAAGLTLGRLATRVARILTGKENPCYTTFLDTGDHVIIINAAQIRVTGLRADQKLYHRYTGFPGGLRTESFKKRFARKPEGIVEDAIVGMLPKTKLGRAMAKKLKVYRDDKHLHQAQKPQALTLARRGA